MPKRSYRKRRKSSTSSSAEEEDVLSKVTDIKGTQKHRCKRGGINALSLAVGRIVSQEEALTGNVLSKSFSKSTDTSQEKYGLQVGSVFSAESNQKEEDHLMNSYIKEELAKRRGVKTVSEVEDQYQQRINELFAVPEHLQTKTISLTEDMLSDQVLTGIPEVDLGITTKIENIEKTDQAVTSLTASSSNAIKEDDELPRNYTHDYARLDKINNTKSTLNILKDDRYI